ncbi:vWA domain-containing protein [Glaciecola sp. 1036]|uniref:vWA domain-containing protein n=1 Tax=Alteromonadaceae TaxID=72275 RepID=UPI003D0016F3
MTNKRREEGFNLSFLDVMACGLGAVILILILVKFNDNSNIPVDELQKLQQELAALEDQSIELQQSLSTEQDKTAAKTADLEALKRLLAQLKLQQQDTNQALKDQLAVIADLETAIAAIAAETANDPIATPDSKEETYLVGLKVEGQRVGILVDSSASMTAESLIEIIRRKIGSDVEKQAGAKWQRTLRTVRWILARLPQNAQFSLVSFNSSATTLGNTSRLQASSEQDLQQVMTELNALVPQNGTNLQAALNEIRRSMPNMTHLYIITDGLPTLVETGAGFPTSRSCKPYQGQQATITGQCRMDVFAHTMKTNPLTGVVTNVILFPLEGDPSAPSAYWGWAQQTRGTFIAPAGTWP